MSRTLQFKRYANTSLSTITGGDGEIIVDETNHALTVHDGVTAGGYRAATESYVNTNIATVMGVIANTDVGLVNELAANVATLNANVASVGVALANTNSNVSTLQVNVNSSIANTNANIASVVVSVGQNASNIAFVAGNVVSINTSVGLLNGNVAINTANIATLMGNVSTLQSNVSTLQSNVVSINAAAGLLSGNVSVLQSNVSTLQTATANVASVFGPYTTSTALQTAKPAASYSGMTAYVGTTVPYAEYVSNGVTWKPVAAYATDSLTGKATGLTTPDGGNIQLLPQYDVVVYGATPSGICAAIAAKQEGASVLLLESSTFIGGMTAGGLSWADVNTQHSKAQLVGLSKQYMSEVAAEYSLTQQSFFTSNPNAEPNVWQRKFLQWLRNWQIPVYTGAVVSSVNKSGTSVYSASFSVVGTIQAKAFVDATYTGDLVALAGCTTTIGRESNATYGETNNGVTAIGTSAQFTNAVDPYITPGVPASGLIYGVSGSALTAQGTSDSNVQAFIYRLCITNDSTKVAFPEPDAYDASKYELLGRHAVANGGAWTTINNLILTYGLRGTISKLDANNLGAFSLDYVSPECAEYITATPSRRAVIEYNAKQYILGFLKFCKTDLRIPAAVRTSFSLYGFCPDEFQAFGGFSPVFYVREGRRLVGDFVMKEADLSSNAFTDEVGYIYYACDVHNVQRVVVGGAVKNEGTVTGLVTTNLGSKVPYRVTLPKSSEATNLWATFALSASHVAFNALRLEPLLMSIGQSTGVAAAIVAATGVTAANVPIAKLKKRMNIQGVGDLNAVILSTEGSYTGGTLTTTGSWANGSGYFGFIGTSYSASAATGASQKFAPNIVKVGMHSVYIKYPENFAGARSSAAPITIVHGGGTTNLTINQNMTGDGGDWYYLGDYIFAKGSPSAHYVQLGTDGTNSSIVSAVKWIPVPNANT